MIRPTNCPCGETCECPIYGPPTDRQIEVLDTICAFWTVNGYGPSMRELADALGIRSLNGVADHLALLRRRRLVTWEPRKSRTLRAINQSG